MAMADKLNAERYSDPTAYYAMKNIEREERRNRPMNFKRGEIYYVESGFATTGSEQRPGRPAVIVSNDKNNEHSTTVEVVYLTTQPKADLPTHVLIRSLSRESTAICEQITTVATERIGSLKGKVTDTEMANIEIAMLVSLDLQMGTPKERVAEVVEKEPMEAPAAVRPVGPEDAGLLNELAAANAKCEMLQSMYESLLSRVIKSA